MKKKIKKNIQYPITIYLKVKFDFIWIIRMLLFFNYVKKKNNNNNNPTVIS